MANTHDYKLEIGDNTFIGEVEINNAGVVGYTQPDNPQMSGRIKKAVENILDLLAVLPSESADLKKFELTVKP